MLIIVENRDIHPLPTKSFNDKTIRRFDVFEVDRPKARLKRTDDIGQLFRVAFIYLDIETVDIGEFFEEHRLALHHRLRGQRADIAKAQNRRPV